MRPRKLGHEVGRGTKVARPYYKEPDVIYGRPKTKIAPLPKGFQSYDEEMRGWTLRQFMRELEKRLGDHQWKLELPEWNACPGLEGTTLVSDPDEVNALLSRPKAVTQLKSADEASHALDLGMVLFAIDPNTPNLKLRLADVAKTIREQHPITAGLSRGRPRKLDSAPEISNSKVQEWREHRIIALHELRLGGHDPHKERKQMALWMFPEIKDAQRRGAKLDRALMLLDDALAQARLIDAQTR